MKKIKHYAVFIVYGIILMMALRDCREDAIVGTMSGGGEPSASGVLFLLAWGFVCAPVGYLIGRWRGRADEGAVYGMALGPLGWLCMAFKEDHRPMCPECGGVIVPGARKCRHCASVLTD
ncbi:MAG: hypothetical protein WCR20_01450 [Verrucomicrobiota bacterium]